MKSFGSLRSLGRLLVVCAGAVSLAACSVHEVADAPRSLEQQADASASGRPVWRASFASTGPSEAAPIARLPDAAGAMQDVQQRLFPNGLRQLIRYSTKSKQRFTNQIEIEVQDVDQRSLEEMLTLQKPTEAGIRSQIGANLPGFAMRVVTEPRANRYGPYGLAVGKSSAGTRCIFAWQWIDRTTAQERAKIDALVSWRIRLCDVDATLDQLAAHVDGLELASDGFAKPKPADLGTKEPRMADAEARTKVSRKLARKRAPVPEYTSAIGASARFAPAAVPPVHMSQSGNTTWTRLDSSLPAEAFLGPVSQKTASTR